MCSCYRSNFQGLLKQRGVPCALAIIPVRLPLHLPGRLVQVNVVNRQLVAVLTTGTLTDSEMLSGHPDASYLLALSEQPLPPAHLASGSMQHDHGDHAPSVDPMTDAEAAADAAPAVAAAANEAHAFEGSSSGASPQRDASVMIGACFVDVATSRIVMGQWYVANSMKSFCLLGSSGCLEVAPGCPSHQQMSGGAEQLQEHLSQPLGCMHQGWAPVSHSRPPLLPAWACLSLLRCPCQTIEMLMSLHTLVHAPSEDVAKAALSLLKSSHMP